MGAGATAGYSSSFSPRELELLAIHRSSPKETKKQTSCLGLGDVELTQACLKWSKLRFG